MFCIKCGKQLPDDAQFCNYCGSKVASVQSQPSPQPAPQPAPAPRPAPQPAPQPAPRPAPAVNNTKPAQDTTQRTAKAKKKGGCLPRILALVLAGAIYLVVRYGAENLFSGNFKFGGISGKELTADCNDGGLYENGYLTYGLARINLPGYSLVKGGTTEGDYLSYPDGTKNLEITYTLEDDVSYSATTQKSILDSYMFNVNYKNITIEQFSKYKVEGFGVVEYIAKGTSTANGTDIYMGELIIFPKNTTDRTMRFIMYSLASNGITSISSVFDTLEISEDFDYEITNTGIVFNSEERITVR